MFNNRKGDIEDTVFVMVTLFIMAIVSVFTIVLLTEYDTEVQANAAFPTIVKSFSTEFLDKFMFIDYLVPMLYVFMLIGVIVTNSYFADNPIYVVIYIFMMGIVLLLSALLSGAWTTLAGSTQLQTIIADMVYTSWVFDNLIILSLVFMVITGAVLYYSPTVSGGGING